jgi:ribosomal protein S13
MQIRDLTNEELADIQTVVEYDNQERPNNQLTVESAINARVEQDIQHFRERARKIEQQQIAEKFANASAEKRNQVLSILSE